MPGGLLIPDTSRPALTLPGGERRQAGALPPGIVEIAGIEPAFERGLDARPFAVGDREPGGVAIAALDDISLAENPLEAEPVSRGRGARRRPRQTRHRAPTADRSTSGRRGPRGWLRKARWHASRHRAARPGRTSR